MIAEKLIVEFEVDKTVDRDYGYQEKYLRYKGEPLDYKAIVKDGNILAIVSAGYRLLENEKVEKVAKEIASKHGLALEIVRDGETRTYIFLYDGDSGVCIRNSVDGSLSFGIDIVLIVGGRPIPIKGAVNDMVKVFKRKHVGSIEKIFAMLEGMVLELMKVGKEYKDFLKKLEEKRAVEYVTELKELLEEIPKKYKSTIMNALLHGMGATITLKDVYESIALKIWQEDGVSMRRKFELLKKLNEAMAILVSYEELVGR